MPWFEHRGVGPMGNESLLPSPEVDPTRVLPPWGGPLAATDFAALATSWITQELAEQAMLRRVDSQQGREATCQK